MPSCFSVKLIVVLPFLHLSAGAVPLLTLNLQKAVPLGYPIPDAWHHQMVYGVDQKGQHFSVFTYTDLSINRNQETHSGSTDALIY